MAQSSKEANERATDKARTDGKPSETDIRELAYPLHVESGCIHGQDLQHWLEAERRLTEQQDADS